MLYGELMHPLYCNYLLQITHVEYARTPDEVLFEPFLRPESEGWRWTRLLGSFWRIDRQALPYRESLSENVYVYTQIPQGRVCRQVRTRRSILTTKRSFRYLVTTCLALMHSKSSSSRGHDGTRRMHGQRGVRDKAMYEHARDKMTYS